MRGAGTLNAREIPRIAAPLLLGAAVLLSFRLEKPAPPVELSGGEPPEPSAAEVRTGLARATGPGSPGYDRGVTGAPVTVVEFADFACPYCARFALASYPTLAQEFVATGQVRWKYVPFVLGIFANGEQATRAAECAGEQGQAAFGKMHDELYVEQDVWKAAPDPAAVFRSIARSAGLDGDRFASCLASDAPDRRIGASNALADQLGVRATPTFFVAGRRVQGALRAEDFRAVLLQALAAARATPRRPAAEPEAP